MFAIVALYVMDGTAQIYKTTPEAGARASKTCEVIFPNPGGAKDRGQSVAPLGFPKVLSIAPSGFSTFASNRLLTQSKGGPTSELNAKCAMYYWLL